MKGLTWRVTTVIVSVLFACYLLVPSILKFGAGKTVSKTTKPEDPWYYAILPAETLKLGLDLQGGLHLVLGIDFDEVTRNSIQKMKSQIRDLADQEKIKGITLEANAKNEV